MVNIGVITFNRLNYTKQCIDGIVKHTDKSLYKLTVVDNFSTDGSVEYLKQLYKDGVIDNLCLMNKNAGVSKAANAAWTKEPKADYFLKFDNDMVTTKDGWLDGMIAFCDKYPTFGTVGYNVEPVSYPVNFSDGTFNMRIKNANIGGACLFIPKYVEKLIGYFNENYSLYGEEDADFHARLYFRKVKNAYMEDEDCLFHLPAGKAAVIDTTQPGFVAKDGLEEVHEKEYRSFKDQFRTINVPKLQANMQKYHDNFKATILSTNAAKDFKFRWYKGD